MSNISNKNRYMVQLSLLIAIQIVLTIAPLGFLRLTIMTITLMHIPTLVGAIVLGPKAGAVLGLVFGISSIISAQLTGTIDVYVYSPLLSGSWWSLFVSIVPRVLFALFAAWIYKALIKAKVNMRVSAGIAAAIGTITHTIMVLGSIYILFGEIYAKQIKVAYDTLLVLFGTIALTNGPVETILAVIVLVAVVKPLTDLVQGSEA